MKVLVNISPHSRPYIPHYYSLFFDKIFHICRDPNTLFAADGNRILWRQDCQFNLSLYSELAQYDKLYCEVPVQAGLEHFIRLVKPGHAIPIARACDLHHLNNPILCVINQIKSLCPKLILVSSCPTQAELLCGLGAPVIFCPTSAFTSIATSNLVPELNFELDGSSLSRYHLRRSKIFSRLLTSQFSSFINVRPYMDYHIWKESFRPDTIYIQHNLSNNFHPPSLTASQFGSPVLINSESVWQTKPFLSVNDYRILESYSYSSYKELIELISLLQADPHVLANICQIPAIYSRLSANVISSFISEIETIDDISLPSTSQFLHNDLSIRFFEEAQGILSDAVNNNPKPMDIYAFNKIIVGLKTKYSNQLESPSFKVIVEKLQRLYGISRLP
ncbi:hypothetical protein [Synechococcus sp. N26]|uniref:hypothetical protein n=1 Tax=Synechococcus sp. N26 TaxID=2575513 RepID=UPI0010BD3F34|nr:hypothetical protein [Synechococcus sp. N26]